MDAVTDPLFGVARTVKRKNQVVSERVTPLKLCTSEVNRTEGTR